jgi:hypothetical protein
MRGALSVVCAALPLAALAASCGGKDICLGCDGNSTPSPQNLVTVQGNIRQVVNPPSLLENMGVFVCSNDPDGPIQQCEDGFTGTADADGNFVVRRVDRGSLRVAFWVDPNNTGSFQPDDLFGELQDPDGFLDNVTGGRTVVLSDVEVNLGTMTATAQEIQIVVSPSPTPNPAPS